MPSQADKAAVGLTNRVYDNGEWKELSPDEWKEWNDKNKDKPKNYGRYGGMLSEEEVATAQNDVNWIKRNADSPIPGYYFVNGDLYKEENGSLTFVEGQNSRSGGEYLYITGSDGKTYKWDKALNKVVQDNKNNSSDNKSNAATDAANDADAKASHSFTDEPYYQNKMATFQSTINQIQNDLNNGRAVYTMYMKFWVGANGTGQTILVDTTSKDWLENCFIDFTHEKNGSGLANQFTLTCMFKPNDRGVRSAREFENKLLTVSASQLIDGNSKATRALVGCCEFQYGYDNLGILSPIYTGMFTGYDSKIENGNLKFTIKGFSNACLALERRLSTKDKYIEGCDENTPFKFLENIVNEEFKDIYIIKYCGGVQASNPHCATDDFMHFSQKTFFQIVQDTLAATLSNSDNPQSDPNFVGPLSPDQKEEENINNAIEESGNLKSSPIDKQIYTFFIDDSKDAKKDANVSGGIIWISLMTKPGSSSDATNYKSYITFNWFGYNGSGINHLVKDWNPQYDGSVLMALAYSLEHEKITEYLTMDKDGNLINTTSLGASRVGLLDQGGGEKILNIALEYDNWSRATQYPYKANMTLIGIPCEIPILGVISIQANLVYGSTTESHHSSGDYMILKIVDKMSSSGFWTSLELFKVNVPTPDLATINDSIGEIIEEAEIENIKQNYNLVFEEQVNHINKYYYEKDGNYYLVTKGVTGEWSKLDLKERDIVEVNKKIESKKMEVVKEKNDKWSNLPNYSRPAKKEDFITSEKDWNTQYDYTQYYVDTSGALHNIDNPNIMPILVEAEFKAAP